MRVEIARLHREIGATMIYVTHDQIEAMTLADKIVVLRAGNIEQVGAPMDLYNDPGNRFVAGFIGSPSMNFLDGSVSGGQITCGDLSPDPITTNIAANGSAVVGARPQHLSLTLEGDSHTVEFSERLGGVTYVHLSAPSGARVVVEITGDTLAERGTKVGLKIDPASVMAFEPQSGRRMR